MIVLGLLVVVALWLLRRWFKGRREDRRAGLSQAHPTYSLAPPTRSTSRLKDHRF